MPPTRYPIGLPTLDDAFGGGLWPGLLFVVQGAPGAGKSSLGIQLAGEYHRSHGGRVYVYAPDEGARAACVRLGQLYGIDRDNLEWCRDDALDELDGAYPAGFINIVDADHEDAVLETFLDQIEEEMRFAKPDSPPPLFVLDSIQAIRTDAEFETRREQIEYAMQLLREFCTRTHAIVVVVSHVSRPAFASKKAEERIDSLAASAESASITRACQAMLNLDGDLMEEVSALLRKNRLHRGAKPSFAMRYDIPRGCHVELPSEQVTAERAAKKAQQSEAQAKLKTAAHEKAVNEIAGEIDRRIRKASPARLSTRQLRELIGGRLDNFNEALRGLETQGVIDFEHGARGALLWGLKK